MESFIAIFGEMAFELLVPLLLVTGFVTVLLVLILLELASRLYCRLTRADHRRTGFSFIHNRFYLYSKRLILITAMILLTFLLLLNSLWLHHGVDWTLERIYRKTHVRISYQGVNGNLFNGRFDFTGLRAHRNGDSYTDFDLHIPRLRIDINYISVIRRPVALDTLRMQNVSGKIIRYRSKPWFLRKKKDFIVHDLNGDNIRLSLISPGLDAKQKQLDIKLAKIRTDFFRRRYAMLDLLFFSSLHGSLQQRPFNIDSVISNGKRTSMWHIEKLTVDELRILLNKRLQWLVSGQIDIDVKNSWEDPASRNFYSAWTLRLSNVKSILPDNIPVYKKIALKPVVRYLNSRQDNVEIRFHLQLAHSVFDEHAATDPGKVWKTVIDSAVKSAISEKIEGFKTRLRKLRLF